MIIIQAAGGLGNQMQQYALYRKFISMGKEARLDISWFTQSGRQDGVNARRKLELSYFDNLPYEICTPQEMANTAGNDGLLDKIAGKLFPAKKTVFFESDMYHPEIFDFQDKYLCGYWACEKYYADILPQLRNLFVFPPSKDPRNQEIAQKMREEISVSIHIRRGDYLDAENAAMFGGICTEAYYESGIRHMRMLFPEAHFYIFSDDPSYGREHYRGNEFTIVDINKKEDSFYDMWLMSCCSHNICANSTFSFWGARLNGNDQKVCVRPSIHKNTQTFVPAVMHELWKGWVLVDPAGMLV